MDYETPLIFEPGSAWNYGVNNDWLGFVVEKVSGMSLKDYFTTNIFEPLGLKQTGTDSLGAFMSVHTKDDKGVLTATEMRMANAADTEVPFAGGHFLYSTVEDYAQFLLALLNDGKSPTTGNSILKPETVKEYIFKDQLPRVGCSNKGVGDIPSTIPPVSCVRINDSLSRDNTSQV